MGTTLEHRKHLEEIVSTYDNTLRNAQATPDFLERFVEDYQSNYDPMHHAAEEGTVPYSDIDSTASLHIGSALTQLGNAALDTFFMQAQHDHLEQAQEYFLEAQSYLSHARDMNIQALHDWIQMREHRAKTLGLPQNKIIEVLNKYTGEINEKLKYVQHMLGLHESGTLVDAVAEEYVETSTGMLIQNRKNIDAILANQIHFLRQNPTSNNIALFQERETMRNNAEQLTNYVSRVIEMADALGTQTEELSHAKDALTTYMQSSLRILQAHLHMQGFGKKTRDYFNNPDPQLEEEIYSSAKEALQAFTLALSIAQDAPQYWMDVLGKNPALDVYLQSAINQIDTLRAYTTNTEQGMRWAANHGQTAYEIWRERESEPAPFQDMNPGLLRTTAESISANYQKQADRLATRIKAARKNPLMMDMDSLISLYGEVQQCIGNATNDLMRMNTYDTYADPWDLDSDGMEVLSPAVEKRYDTVDTLIEQANLFMAQVRAVIPEAYSEEHNLAHTLFEYTLAREQYYQT